MFSAIYFFISLIGLVIASYTDLKERIVSNKITYSMIIAGIAIHILESIFAKSYWPFIICAVATIATFFFSYLMWKAGIWAGGDVKLFTAIAALNPINYFVIGNLFGLSKIFGEVFTPINLPIFPLTLFIFSVFAIFPYTFLLVINGVIRNKEIAKIVVIEMKKILPDLLIAAVVVATGAILLEFFGIDQKFSLIILLGIMFLPKKIKFATAIVLFFAGAFVKLQNVILNCLIIFIPLFFIFLLIKLYSVSKEQIMKKTIKISEMQEGMIPAETIIMDENENILRYERPAMGKIIKLLIANKLDVKAAFAKPKGKVLADEMSAAGISSEQLKLLKDALKEGKLKDEIKIKLSVPMVPAVLIAYLILMVVGDVLWNLIY